MATPRFSRVGPVVAFLAAVGFACSSGGTDQGTGTVGGGATSGGGGAAGSTARRGGSSADSGGASSRGQAGAVSTSSQNRDAGAAGGASDAGLVGTTDGPRRDAATERGAGKDGRPDGSMENRDASPEKIDARIEQDARGGGDADIAVPQGYKLVWSEEFNLDGRPDPKNWNYEKGFVRNNELQWYQPDNATVKDGVLIIEGRKERVSNPNYKAGSAEWKTSRQFAEYTSTSMTTSGLQTWQYGRFEMRGRIPTTPGMWPAWWTLGVKGEWPSNGEIDIMEYYSGKVLANVACGTDKQWTAKWSSATKSLSSLGAGWSDKFHVWRMDWDDQKISLYLDDTLLNTTTLSSMLNADGTSPFKQKVYMILNLAIGGDNGGDPAGTTFPARFEVDYVRVFQKL